VSKNLIIQTYRRYKRYRGLGIKKADIVLDVGSGPHPFYRADILADISIEGSRNDERPFVQADICDLPFHDKSVDFIYCSHILEHVNNPEKALTELQRVGLRGYVAVPSALWEELFGDDREHKWLIEQKGNQLIFTPKDEVFFSHSEAARNSMQKLFKLNPKVMGRFYRESLPLWGIEFKWLENINFKIKSGNPMDIEGVEFWDTVPYPKSIATYLSNFACSFETWVVKTRRRPWQIDLTAYLRCSVCKGKLMQREQDFRCQSCGAVFPIENGVIRMLPEQAKRGGSKYGN